MLISQKHIGFSLFLYNKTASFEYVCHSPSSCFPLHDYLTYNYIKQKFIIITFLFSSLITAALNYIEYIYSMTLTVVFFLLLAFLQCEAMSGAKALLNSTTRPPSVTQVLKLPLVFSEKKSIQGRVDLETSSMRLYDDLVTTGYYSTKVYIGTPPQEFTLMVDTGSAVTYVPCSSCQSCGSHQNPRFEPKLSATYQRIPCSGECGLCNPGRTQCAYDNQYAEKSSSSGVLGRDIMSFDPDMVGNEVVFGCGNDESGAIYSQDADGILGLGRDKVSVMDQLVRMGVVEDSFSLCYGGIDVGGGAMFLGEFPPPPTMVFSFSDPRRR